VIRPQAAIVNGSAARFVDSSPLAMTTDDTVLDLGGYGNEDREEESSCP
jgi:hypothetical protein